MQETINKLYSKRLIIQRDYISPCWEFTGFINPKGYGYMRPSKGVQPQRVHILAYICFVGNYNKKLNVNHKCHNRKCFNPDHLYQGTQKENVHDSIKRGTHKFPMYNFGLSYRENMKIIHANKQADNLQQPVQEKEV